MRLCVLRFPKKRIRFRHRLPVRGGAYPPATRRFHGTATPTVAVPEASPTSQRQRVGGARQLAARATAFIVYLGAWTLVLGPLASSLDSRAYGSNTEPICVRPCRRSGDLHTDISTARLGCHAALHGIIAAVRHW